MTNDAPAEKVTLDPQDEEALEILDTATYCLDVSDHHEAKTALAHLRRRLEAKVVTREWLWKWCGDIAPMVGHADSGFTMKMLAAMLAELGARVEEGK